MHIKRLPNEVINQIAAGEVVQSPSSALKELLENALDCGASRISVEYIDGGLHTLRITDDGSGIDASDLSLVATRFATSKLRDANELNNIVTFGFRGEALAALSYVSFLHIVTRGNDLYNTPNCYLAKYRNNMLESSEAVTREHFPYGSKDKGITGTTVVVENLFHNSPTRRSVFTARKYEEINKIEDIVKKYAIANPRVTFTLARLELPRPGGKSGSISSRFSVPGKCESMSATMQSVYGNSFMKHMIPIRSSIHEMAAKSKEGIIIEGVASDPYYCHPKAKQIVCFINKRLVLVPSCLRKVIERFYQQILPKKHNPYVFLTVDLPPSSVEVNIHPTKSEVRIMYEERCCSLLEELLKKTILVRLHDYAMEAFPSDVISNIKRGDSTRLEEKVKVSPQHLNRSFRDIGQMEKYVIHSPRQTYEEKFNEVTPESGVNAVTREKNRDFRAISPTEQSAADKEHHIDLSPTRSTSEPFHAPKISTKIERVPYDSNQDEGQVSNFVTIAIEKPLNRSAVKRHENDENLLSSVRSILTNLREEENTEARDAILGGTYVGCIASVDSSKPSCQLFIQHQTSLYMLDGDFLLANAAFQNIFWFWESHCWYSLFFSPGYPLNELLGEVTANNSSHLLSVILSNNSEMLAAYFGIQITKPENRLTKIPLLLGKDYIPCTAGIPIILAQIAHSIFIETDEKKCLISISRVLTQWFVYRAGTRRGTLKQSDVQVAMPIIQPSNLTYDSSDNKAAMRKALNEISSCGQPIKRSQEEHDFILHHGGLSHIQKLRCYAPPLSLWEPREEIRKNEKRSLEAPVLCIATTEALYKVFERC